MNISVGLISRELSEHQILLLLYLSKGCNIVTNEGAGFRSWVQYGSEPCNEISVMNKTANKLFAFGLMQPVEGQHSRLYYYAISEKGKRVLQMIDSDLIRRLSHKMQIKDEYTLGSDY